MKSLLMVGIAAAGLLLVGCDKKGGSGKQTTTDSLKNAAKDAGKAVGDLAARAKEEAVATAQDLYEKTSNEVDALADKISQSASAEKPAWEKLVEGVKTQLTEAKAKLEEMRPDNSDWKKISAEFSSLMTKAGESLKSLASQVK